MSTKGDLVPAQKAKKGPWAKNLGESIAAVAASVGVDAAGVAAIEDNCKIIVDSVNKSVVAETTFNEQIKGDNTAINKSVKIIRSYANQIKANANYTEDIGKKLGIIGTDSHFDPTTFKPEVEAKIYGGHVHFSFTKKGAEGANIYSRLAGATEWEKLGFDTHSPYVDTRPLATPGIPEKREYMCYGVWHNQQIGQPSDIVSVVFGG